MKYTSINERIDRWYWFCQSRGVKLLCIFVHPEDIDSAPPFFQGLPVPALGAKVWEDD